MKTNLRPEYAGMTDARAKSLLAHARGDHMPREDSPILCTDDIQVLCVGWLRLQELEACSK